MKTFKKIYGVWTGSDDRGDVPGWVLVTVMTAGLVVLLWTLAGDQLEMIFTEAINRVLNH